MRIVYLIFLSYFTLLLLLTKKGVSVTISPSPIAEVCYVGDRLLVTCNVSDTFMRWRFTYIFENGTIDRSFNEIVSGSVASNIIRPINNPRTDVDLTFIRVSERGARPIVITAEFNDVAKTLNGTTITCSNLNETSIATTTVNIAMEGDRSLLALDVNKSADFLLSGVNVDLQWTHDESFASYDVTTVPPTSITVRGTSANFTAAYNTLYVVRVVAQLLCGETITRRVEINYANCGDSSSGSNKLQSEVTFNSINPALEGSAANITCPPGMALNGPSTAICMENGEWEPGPRDVKCIDSADCGVPIVDDNVEILYNSTVEGAMLSLWCRNSTSATIATCNDDGTWRPSPTALVDEMCVNVDVDTSLSSTIISVVSSLSSFVFGSLLFFTVGYLCAYCVHSARREKASSTGQLQDDEAATTAHVQSTQDNVLYENVQLPKQEEEEEEEENLELKDNVAYGPLKSTVDRVKA